MAGELSPDRLFYWDGSRWVSAVSPDGAWRWDGAAWRQAGRQAPGRRSGQAWIIAGIVIVSLALTSVGVYFAARAFTKVSQRTFGTAFSSSCSSSLAEPGAALHQGDSLCGGTLGPAYVVADCTEGSGAPMGTAAWQKSYAGGTESDWTKTTLSATSQGCNFSPDPDIYLTIETSSKEPPTAIAIADFTYDGRRSNIGMRLACSSSAGCVDISLFPDGIYDLGEGKPGGGWDNLGKGVAFGATFRTGEPNRLILRLNGRHVSVFLNGVSVTKADTKRDQAYGYANFYVDNRGDPTAETVWLQRLYVFESR